MTVEFDSETERLINREIKAGLAPGAAALVDLALRAYLSWRRIDNSGNRGVICVEDLESRGELGRDGLYDAERQTVQALESSGRCREREQAVDAMRELRQSIALGSDLRLKDLVDAGRRM
jgi:hypothetical protein